MSSQATTNEIVKGTKRKANPCQTKSTKKPATARSNVLTEAERASRKRAQNRVSQRCLREKQLVKGQHLSSFFDILRTTSESGGGDRLLFDAHLELLEEHEKMKDALLRMRKKLLSLSNSAALAAEDEIFQIVLDTKPSAQKRASKLPSRPPSPSQAADASQCSRITTSRASPKSNTADEEFPSVEAECHMAEVQALSPREPSPVLLEAETNHLNQACAAFDKDETGPGWSHPDSEVDITNAGCSARTGDPIDYHSLAQPTSDPFGVWDSSFLHAMPLDSYNIWAGVPQPRESGSRTEASKSLTMVQPARLGPEAFCRFVEAACVTYVCRTLNIQVALEEDSMQGKLGYLKQKYYGRVNNVVVEELADVAVGLLGSLDDLDAYIYCVGASTAMEWIMRWRIAPSTTTRLAIPEPFRPTPLQSMNCDHSFMIDCINWPTLRDQIILYGDRVDLETLVADIVANTVIEVPQMQVAFNILDVFRDKILPKVNKHSFVTGGPVEPLSITTPSTEGFAAQLIYQEVTTRMGLTYQSAMHGTFDGAQSHARSPRDLKHELAIRIGLDQLNCWKLSQSFCQKYPFFDCSSFTAAFPMKKCSELLA